MALLADPMGVLHGFLTALAAVTLAVVIYLRFVRPWQVRWGATGEEVARPMPGDGIAGPGARCTTRAVTIQAPAGQVWPLLAQPEALPAEQEATEIRRELVASDPDRYRPDLARSLQVLTQALDGMGVNQKL